MNLVPDWLRATLPPLESQKDCDEPIVYAHYFVPDAAWHYYPSGGHQVGADYEMFGMLMPSEREEDWGWDRLRASDLERMVETGRHVMLDETFVPGPFASVIPYPYLD